MNVLAFEILTASTAMLEIVLEMTYSNKRDFAIKEIRKEIAAELAYRDAVSAMLAENNAFISSK